MLQAAQRTNRLARRRSHGIVDLPYSMYRGGKSGAPRRRYVQEAAEIDALRSYVRVPAAQSKSAAIRRKM
jgi:hypothetical protein